MTQGIDPEWRSYPMEKLFSTIRTSPRGLTSAVAAQRLRVCGSNQLKIKKQGKLLAYLPLVVEAAAVVAMAVGLARGGGHGADGSALVALLAAHFAVGFAESSRAAKSVAADLVARLAPSKRAFWVLRDGVWSAQDATALVLGDIIHISSGDVVPVDARLLESPTRIIKVDQSALTGDPLLTAKGPGDAVYAGSACAKGQAQAVVVSAGVAKGVQTHLRKAVLLAVTEATIGIGECNLNVGMLGAFWNVSLVSVCFNFLADLVAGHVSHNDFAAMVVIGCLFALTGCALWMSSADQGLGRQPGRDPEELVCRLEVLREQGKVSEETAQRCRDLLGMEPVCDELAAALANYFQYRRN